MIPAKPLDAADAPTSAADDSEDQTKVIFLVDRRLRLRRRRRER